MIEPTVKTDKYELYLGDCLDVMQALEPSSVDMVVTSPPYNVGVDYNDQGGEQDHHPIEEYRQWIDRVNMNLRDILKIGGRYCIELGGGGRDFPIAYYWQDSAYKLGFGLYSEIVIPHRKTNPTAWGSYLRADNVFTIPNFHYLFVLYKYDRSKFNGNTTITKEEFVEWTRGVWSINYSVGKIPEHPATFPVELPKRCVRLFGHENDVIIDPFMGTGTTALACIHNNRKFIGIEKEPKYFELAEKRIRYAALQMAFPAESMKA